MFAGSEKSAFIIVEGDAEFRKDGDEVIVIHDPHGEDEVTVTTRDGWEFSDGTTSKQFSHKVGTTNEFDLVGRDGENWTRVEVRDDHAHHQTEEEDHVSSPIAEAASAPDEAVYLYAAPLVGVLCPTNSASWRIATNGMHQITLTTDKCNVPGCNQSGRSVTNDMPIVITVDQLEKTFTVIPSPVDGRLISGQYTFNYFARWANTNCIEQLCETFAATNSSVNVFKMSVTNDLYIGLDMTDIGKTTNMVRNAWVEFQPEPSLGKYDLAYEWKTAGLCRIVPETAGNRAARFKNISSDTASVNYRDQELECSVTIASKENAAWSSATGTNQFTVVKVDVEIEMKEDKYTKKGENELAEEKRGAYLYHIPDATNGLWTVEATNELRKVEFKFEPSNLPEDQTVTIEADENLLYELKDGKYNPARKNYTLKDLKKRKFVLHGHRRSEKYLGDEIRFIHDLSGAIDVAKCTVFGRPLLVPDYDRNGIIDDKDEAKATDGKTVFRFWVNDDDDDRNEDGTWGLKTFGFTGVGSINEKTKNYPGSGKNFNNGNVDGRCDLIDFTPYQIKLSCVFPEGTPEDVKSNTTWSVKSSCLNVVWTGLAKTRVGDFQTNKVSCCGQNLDEESYLAPVVKITTPQKMPKKFYQLALGSDDFGVVFVEGRTDGDDFIITGEYKKQQISKGDTKVSVSGVEEMYRWIDLRYVYGGTCANAKGAGQGEPRNNPDSDCNGLKRDGRHIFFIHGFLVDGDAARGWGAEIFKRLWQSGSTSLFSNVDWRGDVGQFELPSGTKESAEYYEACCAAFMSSKALKENLMKYDQKRVILAHSLGNVLASSAIKDQKLGYEKYYMLNAAAPVLAYEPARADELMVNSEWLGVKKNYRATHWHRLFDAKKDFRGTLAWQGRFEGIQNVINCHSSTDEVVGDIHTCQFGPNTLGSVWTIQEKTKGKWVWDAANLILPATSVRSEGGWGKNGYWFMKGITNPGIDSAKANKLTREQVIEHPLFSPFVSSAARMASTADFGYNLETPDWYYFQRAALLSHAIPADSFAAGANMIESGVDNNVDYMTQTESDWPRDDQEWLHSDLKNVAYYHNYLLFKGIVERSFE